MSTLSAVSSQEIELVEMKQHIERPLVLVKDGPLKGRDVALISLDNPADLDPEIEKNKSLANKELTKAKLWCVASLIVAAALLTLSILGAIFGSPLVVVAAKTITFMLGWSIPSLLMFCPARNHERAAEKYKDTNEELKECKENMAKNEFKLFTAEFGNALPLDQLLQAHRLFKRTESISHSEIQNQTSIQERKNILQNDMTKLRREILALRD